MAKKVGSSGGDVLTGGSAGDQLSGQAGDDLLHGGAGNDTLYGGWGDDRLSGGDNDDLLHGVEGNDQLDGGAGIDKLYGDDGNDQLDGGGGNDQLYGGWGDDLLIGGEGHDTLCGGHGADYLDGGTGNDLLHGDEGDDQLDGGDGSDKLYGDGGNDELNGGTGNDKLYGGWGDDRLSGGDGVDLLDGQKGNDQLDGGSGDDTLYGDGGNDQLDGGIGHDKLDGGFGDDRLSGGDGIDLLNGQKGNDQLDGGAGGDTLYGGDGNDQLAGGTGNDKLYGDGGNALFTYRTGDGNDVVDGGQGGADTIRLEVDDGWILKLSKGKVVSNDGDYIGLSGGAAGTIKLADGSTISFKGTERIDASPPQGGNLAPVDLAFLGDPVDETAPDGSVVGTATASDPDAGDTLTYSLTNDAGGRFAIDQSTGAITVVDASRLDHESTGQHQITIKATDAGGLSTSKTFTIEVADANEAPGSPDLDANEVAEGAAGGTVVGTATASDPDAGDTLTYSLTDDAGGRFAIDPSTGVITVADGSLLDFETAGQHSIEVKVADASGLSATHTFTIAVGDANETPAILGLDANEVLETAADNTVVGTVGASDPDGGDMLTYSLTDDAGGRFAIDPHTGVVTVLDGGLLDHDVADQHAVTVKVTDAGGLSGTETFTIAVAAVNAPVIQTLDADHVAENAAAGTVIGTVTATDSDPGDTLTYALSDDAGGRFAIDPSTGVITVADGALLDFEAADQHAIEVEVTDGDGLSTARTFTIAVSDVNEAPAIQALDANEIHEGAATGTVIGTVGASDPDAGDTLTFALTDDADGRFAIDPSTGDIIVADGTLLDFETTGQHSLEVEVTDGQGLSATQTFAIAVTNVNEAPVIHDLNAGEVLEGAVDGTMVGTVTATDPDMGDTLTYGLSDDAGGRFAIDPETGVVTVADGSLINHGMADQHSIVVTVTDADGLSAEATYLIQVQPDNSGNNILNGDGAANVIDGGPGDDTINGGGGDDHLLGGSGYDTLNGDEGNDRLEGGDGNDFLFGHGGDDHLIGGGGGDQLLSGVGNDRLDGGDGNDQLFGNGGDDVMDGGDGDDELFGSVGADVLTGGLGNDFLSGGMGSDRFVFTSAADGVDEVFDFGAGDVLAIGAMLEGFAAGDEAAFVKLVDDGTNTTLQVDVDGAANGEAYQSVAVLTRVTGTTLADLVDAGQLDFWMS